MTNRTNCSLDAREAPFRHTGLRALGTQLFAQSLSGVQPLVVSRRRRRWRGLKKLWRTIRDCSWPRRCRKLFSCNKTHTHCYTMNTICERLSRLPHLLCASKRTNARFTMTAQALHKSETRKAYLAHATPRRQVESAIERGRGIEKPPYSLTRQGTLLLSD